MFEYSFYFCPDISKILFGIDSILKSLVKQDVSFNNLPSLPTNIGYGTQNLEKLSIQLKKHCYFLASISEMHSLKYLDEHINEINGIPNPIKRLTKLEVLNLSSNFTT